MSPSKALLKFTCNPQKPSLNSHVTLKNAPEPNISQISRGKMKNLSFYEDYSTITYVLKVFL